MGTHVGSYNLGSLGQVASSAARPRVPNRTTRVIPR